jgi:hypothetical protein
MSIRDGCPAWGSGRFKKSGPLHTGKQHPRGKACGRQFVSEATQRRMDEADRLVVERVLCEKLSLHGLCRAVGVSIRGLRDVITGCFAALPEHLPMQPVASSRAGLLGWLEVEADEPEGFVQRKAHPQGLWPARDRQTRPIVACPGRDLSRDSARQLWCKSSMKGVVKSRPHHCWLQRAFLATSPQSGLHIR